MPEALKQRLQDLLDEQDHKGKLSAKQRKEATALTELAEMLTLMKLRAEVASRRLGA
jgi:hypothetical protein